MSSLVMGNRPACLLHERVDRVAQASARSQERGYNAASMKFKDYYAVMGVEP